MANPKKGKAEPVQPSTPSKKRKRPTSAERRALRGLDEPPKCHARRRDGTPCGAYAVKGATVCRMHGGAAPQVREKANQRLLEMIMPAMKELRRIMESPTASDADKLRAVSMVLNRTGYSERQSIDIGLRAPSEFERLIGADDVFEFDRSELAEPAALPGGGGDGLDEALTDMLDKRERDRAREANTRLRNNGHDVISGEVVGSGPIDFPNSPRPRTRPTELDPDRPRRSTFDRYESDEDDA